MTENLEDKTVCSEIIRAASAGAEEYLSHLRLPERYAGKSLIGQGGMGIVVKTTDLHLQRDVAVKLMEFDGANDRENQARFLREAQILATLDHPNIVKILSSGFTEDGIAYNEMELLQGHSLAAELSKCGALEVQRFFVIFDQVLAGLAYAATHKIVHRDLKPSNIIIGQNCEVPDFVTLIDFGIARKTKEDSSLTTNTAALTQTNTILGSPLYMSPEQCRAQSATAVSDVYALGCVMYECLTGNPPFKGDTAFETMYQHMNTASNSLADVARADSGKRLGKLIDRCLQKNAADRPQSMEEVRKELSEIFATPVNLLGIVQDTRKSVQAKRVRILPYVVVVLAVVSLLALTLFYRHKLHEQDSKELDAMTQKYITAKQAGESNLMAQLAGAVIDLRHKREELEVTPPKMEEEVDDMFRNNYCKVSELYKKCHRDQDRIDLISQAIADCEKYLIPLQHYKWELVFLMQRADAYVHAGKFSQAEKDLGKVAKMVKRPMESQFEYYFLLSRINLCLHERKFDLAQKDLARLGASCNNVNTGRLVMIGEMLGLPITIKDAYSSITQMCKSLKPKTKKDEKGINQIIEYCSGGSL